MISGITIRPEEPRDQAAIYHLTKIAFEPMSFSDGSEPDCLNKLRDDGDLTLSLVAVDDGRIVGHVAFSPVAIEGTPGNWFGLGPISVEPARQKSGIGSALVNAGLEILRQRNALGCVLTGDPAYYARFGFISDENLTYRDLDWKYVQWLAFGTDKPNGEVTFSPGLEMSS